MDSNKEYIEIAVGSVSNRGSVIELNQLASYLKPETELYRSMFVLDSTAFDHFQNEGSIRSYKGEYSLDKITFDIDKGKNTGDSTINYTRYFVEDLYGRGIEHGWIRVWFSGTGFHIEIPEVYGFESSVNLPSVVKETIRSQFNKDIDTIYDRGRLIRVGYSYNSKSQLYKTPLMIDELNEMSYDNVCELSKEFKRKDYTPNPLPEAETVWNDDIVYPRGNNVSFPKVDTGATTTNNVTCVQKMYNAGEKEGHCHNMLLRMNSAWKRAGVTHLGALSMSQSWAPAYDLGDLKKIVDSVYERVYSYSCQDVYMDEYCDPKCKYFSHKNYGLDIVNSINASENFKIFARRNLNDCSFNLKDIYNIKDDYRFFEGELAVIMGDTKIGKTAWVQNVCVNLNNMNSLMMSLEVHEPLIFRRNTQIATGKTKDEILDIYKNGTDEEISIIENTVRHIQLMTVAPDIATISDIMQESQAKILVVDTIDAIKVRFCNDPMQKMEKVITDLKQLAQSQNIIIIGISHISKGASDGILNVHSAKGNSVIEQKADKVIGIVGDRLSQRRTVRSLASRDEAGFILSCKFDHETFQFQEYIQEYN